MQTGFYEQGKKAGFHGGIWTTDWQIQTDGTLMFCRNAYTVLMPNPIVHNKGDLQGTL